jgi:hypothetical protein
MRASGAGRAPQHDDGLAHVAARKRKELGNGFTVTSGHEVRERWRLRGGELERELFQLLVLPVNG